MTVTAALAGIPGCKNSEEPTHSPHPGAVKIRKALKRYDEFLQAITVNEKRKVVELSLSVFDPATVDLLHAKFPDCVQMSDGKYVLEITQNQVNELQNEVYDMTLTLAVLDNKDNKKTYEDLKELIEFLKNIGTNWPYKREVPGGGYETNWSFTWRVRDKDAITETLKHWAVDPAVTFKYTSNKENSSQERGPLPDSLGRL